MTQLFPMIQPELEGSGAEGRTLPLCREAAWDFAKNVPLWQGGNPVLVTGAQAVLVWAWKALQVPRYRHEIYSWNYGSQCDDLMGRHYTAALKNAEAARYVRECLAVNPYISEVQGVTANFDQGRLRVDCTLATVYGEVELHV